MANLFKKNDFNPNYKPGRFDKYKAIVNQLDEETKRKLDKQRTYGMMIVVAFLVIMIAVLAITGIGVDRNVSASGNVFLDKENVLIECFGDSLTEGYTVSSDETESQIVEITYPKQLQTKLLELFNDDGHKYNFEKLDVRNYGQSGSVLQDSTYSRLSGTADIVVIQYTANNFIMGIDYENTLEKNIRAIGEQGGFVFVLNYPILSGSSYEDKLLQANNYIKSTAASIGAQFIDINEYFNNLSDFSSDDLFAADGIHLTQEGYILMADYIAEQIHDYYYLLY